MTDADSRDIVWTRAGLVTIYKLIGREANKRDCSLRSLAFEIDINPQTFSNLAYNLSPEERRASAHARNEVDKNSIRKVMHPSIESLAKIAPYITNPANDLPFHPGEFIAIALKPELGLVAATSIESAARDHVAFLSSIAASIQKHLSAI